MKHKTHNTKRHTYPHLSQNLHKNMFDHVVTVAAFLYPLSGVPQLLSVMSDSSHSVSIISWFSFLCFSILFLCYGIVHAIKPMVVTNILWVGIDAAIVVTLLMR